MTRDTLSSSSDSHSTTPDGGTGDNTVSENSEPNWSYELSCDEEKIPRLWLRLLCAATAFLPLAAVGSSWLAYRVGIVWIAGVFYFYPLIWLIGFGDSSGDLLEQPSALWTLGIAYCCLIAWSVDRFVLKSRDLPPRVPRQRVVSLLLLFWAPALLAFSPRVWQHLGITSPPCPDRLTILSPSCSKLDNWLVFPVASFIDGKLVASFVDRAGVVDSLVAEGALVAVEAPLVPSEHWSYDPIWWDPDPSAATIYRTPKFPLEWTTRGPDGDHYLFIVDRASAKVHVVLKANF